MDSKTSIRGIVSVAVLASAGLSLPACKGSDSKANAKDASADRVVPVIATPVVQRDMPIYLDGLGNVVAWNTVTVHTQVDGRIDCIAFREGQEVHKGDLLAQIDPRPFQAVLNSAQAALARDQAQLVGAKRNLDRDIALLKDGLASQQTVDDQQVTVNQLQATLGADRATIDSARLNLDYSHITSPLDGVTGIRLIDQGNIAHASDPSGIVVLTQLDPIAVIFTLPQDDLEAISKELAKGEVKVQAISRDGATTIATGTLTLIDNQINQNTATIRLKAKFDNPKRTLWPNEFVKTRLLLETRKDALVVPAVVVQRGPQGTFAYVVDADNKAQVRPIQVDVTEGDQTIVSGGLKAGDVVVTENQYQLKAGIKVSVSAPAKAKSTGDGDAKPAGDGAGKAAGGGAGKPAGGAGKPAGGGDGKAAPPASAGSAKAAQ